MIKLKLRTKIFLLRDVLCGGKFIMRKESNDKWGLGLALGIVFGLAINNLALGLALWLVFGSISKVKNKE